MCLCKVYSAMVGTCTYMKLHMWPHMYYMYDLKFILLLHVLWLLRIVGTCNVMYTFYEIVKNEMHIYIIPLLPVLYVSVIVQ